MMIKPLKGGGRMGFWQNMKRIFTDQPQEKAINDTAGWDGHGFHFTSWANQNFWGSRNHVLRTNDEVFGVISRLANTVSSLPIHEYHNYKETNDAVAQLLTNEANPSMSSFSLINQLEVSRNTDGNAYAYIERDNKGVPIALWPIDPGAVIVKRNLDDNSIWYQIDSDEYHFLLFNTDIIHVKHISPLTGVLGISPLEVLKGPLTFQKAVQDFSLSEMDKKDSYIIQYDRSVSPEKREAMIKDFQRMMKENGGAVVQEKGFEFDRFESKFQPGDLSTAESITRSRVATAFNVPLSFLEETTSQGNGKSNEQVMTQFVQMTLTPILKQYESEFNRKLLTRSDRAKGFYFKFNVNGLLRGDTAARTSFYQMMLRSGVATPNDLRKLEDLPVVDEPNANKLWFSGDLYPIDMAGQRQPSNNNLVDDSQPSKGGEDENDDAKVSDDQAGSQKEHSKYVY